MKRYQVRQFITGLQIARMNKRRSKKARKWLDENCAVLINSDAWVTQAYSGINATAAQESSRRAGNV